MTKLRLAFLALLLTLTVSQPACNRYGWEMAGHFAEAVITVAAVATVLAFHDAHYHSPHCGHRHRHHEGRRVYEYQGRWEYYDEYSGRWYAYDDLGY